MPNKTALITGSDGFVGRHFTKRLLADGWTVARVDVKSGTDCREYFAHCDTRFDLVLHMAAVVGGKAKIDGQPMQVATDLAIDSDFFQFVMRTRPVRSVYFSSSAAYPIAWQNPACAGTTHYGPMSEERIDLCAPEYPDAVYGWVKLTGEQIADYANKEGAGIYVFRPFSGYGSDQDLDYPFPSFIRRTLDEVDRFEVWGDGTQVRDWIHIDDVVQGVLNALDWDPVELGPVNLATGTGHSMLETISKCLEAAKHEAEIVTFPDKPVGVMHRVGDVTRMSKFHTAMISLEEGISRALFDNR